MYRSIGAGPGNTVTYYVDAPYPWGDNTEVTIPVEQLVEDAMAAAQPGINAAMLRGLAGMTIIMALAVGAGAWALRR
jgi:hypothetical protein